MDKGMKLYNIKVNDEAAARRNDIYTTNKEVTKRE